MTTEIFYKVDNVSHYDYDVFESLEKATEAARSKAWANGRDYHVLKTVAIARTPEVVNTVKVDAL